MQGITTARSCSWHPKVALVCYLDESGAHEWRFWIGSRNLTGSTDLDAGLLIIGRPRGIHRQFRDVARLAEGLLTEANWTDQELAELRQARWESPAGIRLKELRWRRPGGNDRFVMSGKRSAHAIFGMSPFLDQDGINEAFSGTVASSVLLTSRFDARKVAPLAGMKLLVRNPPQPLHPADRYQSLADLVGFLSDDADQRAVMLKKIRSYQDALTGPGVVYDGREIGSTDFIADKPERRSSLRH